MASINKVILVGRLGQDPEIRYTSSGTAVANFTIATNEKWTGKNGNVEERVEWHKVIAWNKLAEICGEYLGKGKEIYIEGKIQTRKWDKDGETRYSTEIVAQVIQFLGGGNGGASKGRGSSHDSGPPPLDEDIPF